MTTKIDLTNIADTALTTLTGPKVTTIVYPGDDTATDTAGGQTINLTGNGFQSGCSVLVGSTAASVVSFISSTQISFTAPVQTAGTYVIYVINPDGGTAISIPGISYSGTPNWTTSAGSLGTAYETGAISATLTATGDAPITYTLVSGTLPTGSSLNSNGTLSGTAVATASATTYSFTIKATDAQNQDTNRAFSITINPDVVTWSTPADSTTYNVYTNSAIANVTMSATSAAGGSITYTADTLPTGLSITGANIAGTPTVAASTTTTLTATATSTRTATRTINWVVTVANDTYFKNTTLLLNGETTVTPFISDASTNNFALTIAGDTKPVLFNPYTPGYYSNYFDGSGDYLTPPLFNFGTGDFTVEAWIYPTGPIGGDGGVNSQILYISTGASTRLAFRLNSLNKMDLYLNAVTPGVTTYTSNTVCSLNTWYHLAAVRTSGMIQLYVNGVLNNTPSASIHDINGNDVYTYIGSIGASTTPFIGYISNFRITNTAVYTSNFTPSTTPLTAISGTRLLTCQSNRIIDNSTNAYSITRNGDVSVSPNIPFTANASYSTYGSTYFDGTGDYLTTSDNTAFQFGTGDFTVKAWVYLSVVNSSQRRFWSYQASGSSTVFWVGTSTTNKFSTEMRGSSGTGDTQIYSTTTPVANTWYHVAFTRSGTTTYLFVNGTLETTTTGQNQNIASGGTPNIGQHNSLDYWYGYIADLRIVKGTAVYTSAFTPPTTPLTAIANTSLLTLQYNGGANNQGIIDNSNFNNIITRNGNTSQGTFSPYSVTGWSNYFNGSSDYIKLPNSQAGYQMDSGNFTIEFWTYPTTSTNPGRIVNNWQTSTSTASSWEFICGGTALYFAAGTNGITNTVLLTSTNFTLNTWHHVAATRIGNVFTLYLNGVVQESATASFTLQAGNTFTIGARNSGGTYAEFYAGYISNLRVVKGTGVYTAAFTPPTTPLTPITNTSVLTCQSNRFVDNSTNNYTLTPVSAPSVQAFGPFGSVPEAVPISYSNYFDGTGDYLYTSASSANAMGTGDYTVEAWIYVTAAFGTTGSGRGAIISNRGQESAGAAFMLQHYNGKIYFGTSGTDVIVGSTTMVTNTWYHVVVSRSSGTVRLFLNGVSDATAVTGNSTNHSDTNAFYVGVDGAYDRYPFTGYISNARLVKGTAVYTSAFTPPTTPLTAIANTSLLTCQSTRMIDNSTNAFTITAVGNTVPRTFNPFGYTAQTYTSYTPSLHGGSAYFDGTGDYLTVPNNTNLQFRTGDFTVEGWIFPTAVGSSQKGIISKGTNTTGWEIRIGGAVSGGLDISYTSEAVTNSTVVTTNSWHHFALTRSGTAVKVFLDGVVVSSATTATDFSQTDDLKIGDGRAGSQFFTGYISDVRVTKGTAIYTSNFVPPTAPLTNYSTTIPAQLLLNFNNGGIIDQHGTNVLETVGNAQLSTAVKKYNVASMYFDGTGDYLTLPYNKNIDISTGDFTIESWVYATTTTNSVDSVWGYGNYGGMLYHAGTTWSWEVGAPNGVSNHFTLTGTASLNAWHHIACTRYGSTFTLWIDGVSASTNTTASDAGSPRQLYIGWNNSTSGSQVFTGYIDDLRITKGYARYTTTFTPPTSALITK